MSEPRWWIKEWPDIPGMYVAVDPNGCNSCRMLTAEFNGIATHSFFGPIPDRPKELPSGRRFKARHKTFGLVSGLYVAERSPVLMAYHVFYWEKKLLHDCWTEMEYLDEIHWLDEETP